MNRFNEQLRDVIPPNVSNEDVVFVCIGTDRSTGDSLGPYVGTMLTKLGYTNVFGTLDENCNALNLEETLHTLPSGKIVIGIDSCLGLAKSVGNVRAAKGPVKPGAGVSKNLPPVGDYSIIGIVNVGGFMEYFVLQNTRLSSVIRMAEQIVDGITSVFPNHPYLELIAVAKEE